MSTFAPEYKNNTKTKTMLKGILSIAGQSGLYKLISQGKNAIIVESLENGKRLPAQATARISALEDITMYSEDGDVKLSTVMSNIFKYSNGSKVLDPKKASADELKAEMGKALPNWDKERIYVSDIKKLFSWYNILVEAGIVKAEEELVKE